MTGDQSADGSARGVERLRWPIGFVLLIGVTALYLGWRLVQGFGALARWITG